MNPNSSWGSSLTLKPEMGKLPKHKSFELTQDMERLESVPGLEVGRRDLERSDDPGVGEFSNKLRQVGEGPFGQFSSKQIRPERENLQDINYNFLFPNSKVVAHMCDTRGFYYKTSRIMEKEKNMDQFSP